MNKPALIKRLSSVTNFPIPQREWDKIADEVIKIFNEAVEELGKEAYGG